MTNSNNDKRTLGYKKARAITAEELEQIGGGSGVGTTHFTTKQTFDSRGGLDFGGDIQWD